MEKKKTPQHYNLPMTWGLKERREKKFIENKQSIGQDKHHGR